MNHLAISAVRPFRSQLSMRRFASTGESGFKEGFVRFNEIPDWIRALLKSNRELAIDCLALEILKKRIESFGRQINGKEFMASINRSPSWLILCLKKRKKIFPKDRTDDFDRLAVKAGFESWGSLVERVNAARPNGNPRYIAYANGRDLGDGLQLSISLREPDLEREPEGRAEGKARARARRIDQDLLNAEITAGRELEVRLDLSKIHEKHDQMRAILMEMLAELSITKNAWEQVLNCRPSFSSPLPARWDFKEGRIAYYNFVLGTIGLTVEQLEKALPSILESGRAVITLSEPLHTIEDAKSGIEGLSRRKAPKG